MYKFVLLSDKDRDFIFSVVSAKKGLRKAIIEKDFWVCLTLDYLFNKSIYGKYFIFKGGTSLSKGFNLINRFSEDIDLILNCESLGITKQELLKARSNTKQDSFNKNVNNLAKDFIREKLLPDLKDGLFNLLKKEINVEIDIADGQVINFYYPKLYGSESILQFIKLEIGPLASLEPTQNITIRSYVGEEMKDILEDNSFNVLTISPIRTFWEKATILHREANRLMEKDMPKRYSRHYYDLYMLGHSIYKDEALQNIALLKEVVTFKNKFYRDNWAKYEETLEKNFKLVPPDYRLKQLKSDYKNMQDMLYGNVPTIDQILKYLKQLETEINGLNL